MKKCQYSKTESLRRVSILLDMIRYIEILGDAHAIIRKEERESPAMRTALAEMEQLFERTRGEMMREDGVARSIYLNLLMFIDYDGPVTESDIGTKGVSYDSEMLTKVMAMLVMLIFVISSPGMDDGRAEFAGAIKINADHPGSIVETGLIFAMTLASRGHDEEDPGSVLFELIHDYLHLHMVEFNQDFLFARYLAKTREEYEEMKGSIEAAMITDNLLRDLGIKKSEE